MLRVSLIFRWNSPSSTESLHLVKGRPCAGSVRRSEQLSVNLAFLNNLGLYLKHCVFTNQYISLLPSLLSSSLLCLHKAVKDPGAGSSFKEHGTAFLSFYGGGNRSASAELVARSAVWRSAGDSRPGGSAKETSVKRKQLREIEENILRQRIPFYTSVGNRLKMKELWLAYSVEPGYLTLVFWWAVSNRQSLRQITGCLSALSLSWLASGPSRPSSVEPGGSSLIKAVTRAL